MQFANRRARAFNARQFSHQRAVAWVKPAASPTRRGPDDDTKQSWVWPTLQVRAFDHYNRTKPRG